MSIIRLGVRLYIRFRGRCGGRCRVTMGSGLFNAPVGSAVDAADSMLLIENRPCEEQLLQSLSTDPELSHCASHCLTAQGCSFQSNGHLV